MITIFSMYIAQCLEGVGCNSYQGHVNDSGEFWGVPHHHFYANGHGWTIGTSFPYIRRGEDDPSPQCKYIAFCLVYCLLYSHSTLYTLSLNTFYKVSTIACVLCHVLCNKISQIS
jgi:hypothetical protein